MLLSEHEELSWRVLEGVPQAAWLASADRRAISRMNPVCRRFFSGEVPVGAPLDCLFDRVHLEDAARVKDVFNGPVSVEYRLAEPGRPPRRLRTSIFLMPASGERQRLAGIVEDLDGQAGETFGIEQLKHEFVSTVSHELRTPMTSIAASLGLLLSGTAGDLDERTRRLLTIAEGNSQRLIRLINDILDLETLGSGEALWNIGSVDVAALVEATVEANRGFADRHDVAIRVAAPQFQGFVRADPDRLTQALTNLLANAIKFTPPRGDVAVEVAMNDRYARISVRDSGPGVPPSFRSRIFGRFAQADVSTTRPGGSGLGLSIAKQIMDRMEGAVDFRDAPGGGSIFYLDIPLWAERVQAA